MTLSGQLFAGITAIFAVLLVGIEAIYVSTTRANLERQLDAHANETATSLALALGSRAGALEPSLVNVMVNPVFDRGHFSAIEVQALDGRRVFGRQLERDSLDVPRWFAALVPLEGPSGEALISAGWRQVGKVVVRVHPGFAYRQLYDTSLATLAWLAALFAIALAAMRMHLAGLLRPLREIEQTALAISNRMFVSIDVEPRTRELRQVTRAMNSLSAKVREAIAEEAGHAERLRREAFADPLTGRLNRRGFEQLVSAAIGDSGEIHSGALVLLSVARLDEINRTFGLSRGDDVMKHLAGTVAAGEAAFVGRWQGTTLAALLPNVELDHALGWARKICADFADRLRADALPDGATLSCGLAHYSSADHASLMQLAEAAESALAQAQTSGSDAIAVSLAGSASPAVELRGEIEAAIANDRVVLLGQQVISIATRAALQMEIFSSLTGTDGAPIAAGRFVPVASQYGLLPRLDRKVMTQAVAAIDLMGALPAYISVNVSMQSIADAGFRTALRDLLQSHRPSAARLVIEVTGYAASRSPELAVAFAAEIRPLGARVALDNFDLDRRTMAIVHELLPAYLKLAPAFTRQIALRQDLRFIVEAMVRMLRPLEIPLIAQGVEDPAEVEVLARLGFGGYQGYAVEKPVRIA